MREITPSLLMADDLGSRTEEVCDQLKRYGGHVFSSELLDVLWELTNLNDDLWHLRDEAGIREGIEKAKQLLDKVLPEAPLAISEVSTELQGR